MSLAKTESSCSNRSDDLSDGMFPNPLLPAPSQDPWVTRHAGKFLATTTDGKHIVLRQSADLTRLFRQPATRLWRAPRTGPASRHLWAPELHRMGERWFVYYAADDGRNWNHRIFLLESVGDDPAGPYLHLGQIETGGWSIDATVLPGPTGENYLLWSGWATSAKGPQNLYIAPLRDPQTLAMPRVLLARPEQSWERGGGEIIEGPAVWRRGALTGVVYSASASWTVHACLGMLIHRGGDYLDPAAWTKVGPVFQRTTQTWGIGHCSLIDLGGSGAIFYHAKTKRTRGWRDRHVRAQHFSWTEEGLPHFGEPVGLPLP